MSLGGGIASTIHGNFTALQAVLADIKSQNIDQIVYLGDTFFQNENYLDVDLRRVYFDTA